MAFNAKKFNDNRAFICGNCAKDTNYKKALSGCPHCGYHLFKVATRSGTPTSWDPDRPDPYERMNQRSTDTSKGKGYKMNTPGDEHDMGGSGLGTRFRGGLAPRDWSATSEEYQDQIKEDIPGSNYDLSQSAPEQQDTERYRWFSDPEDALSMTKKVNDDLEGRKSNQPLEGEPNKARAGAEGGSSEGKSNDDSIFSRTNRRIRGIRR